MINLETIDKRIVIPRFLFSTKSPLRPFFRMYPYNGRLNISIIPATGVYYRSEQMILSFRDRDTESIFHQQFSKRFPKSIQKTALRKLILIDNANNLNDLRKPPANHLEKLVGNRVGYYSIRINAQFRICFKVIDHNKFVNVEIIDYH